MSAPRREALVREPAGVVERVVVFRDQLGAEGRRGWSAEGDACRFWLEHRWGPRRRSASIPPAPGEAWGRALHGVDFEETCERIWRAVEAALPREWRGPVVVALGWRIGPRRLRQGPWLARAGFRSELPKGWSRAALDRRAADLRAVLIEHGLVDREVARDTEAVEMDSSRAIRERPLIGWKAIGEHLGVSERTARRWGRELGLPVRRVREGAQPRAYPAELAAWEADRQAS